MATMIHDEARGLREFRVPIAAPLPGWPLQSDAELLILGRDGDRRVELRFFPSATEAMARLPGLVKGTALAPRLFDLARAAAQARPVVTYEAGAAVIAALPAGLGDLAALERFLETQPPLFRPADYQLAALGFTEDGQ